MASEEAELRVKAYDWTQVAVAKYKWKGLMLNAAPDGNQGAPAEVFCRSHIFAAVWSPLTELALSAGSPAWISVHITSHLLQISPRTTSLKLLLSPNPAWERTLVRKVTITAEGPLPS